MPLVCVKPEACSTTTHSSCRREFGGCLLLLYGQPATRIVMLRVEQIQLGNDRVLLRLGDDPIELPPPLASLVRTNTPTPPDLGCFPAPSPAPTWAPSASVAACTNSASSTQARREQARCWRSPPPFRRRSSRSCSATTTTPQTTGAKPRAATGHVTPASPAHHPAEQHAAWTSLTSATPNVSRARGVSLPRLWI